MGTGGLPNFGSMRLVLAQCRESGPWGTQLYWDVWIGATATFFPAMRQEKSAWMEEDQVNK